MSKDGCDMRIMWGDIGNISQISKGNLAFSLCAFISEVKKLDWGKYPGATLYQIIICLQFYLQKHGINWKLLDDPNFVHLQFTLDNIMKARAKQGLGQKRSAQVISVTDEEKMWSEGVLGESNPDQLWDTIMYLLGINLALQGGKEHQSLQCPGYDSQLRILTDSKGQKYLQYDQDFKHKTNQAGLTSHVSKPKSIKVYGSSDSSCNVVRLFEKYMKLLPKGQRNGALYKYSTSKRQMSPCQWYSDKPISINSIKKVVKKLTEAAGLTSRFSNHSLQATCATRMFAAGVDEQVIKSFTRHQSDAVCDYKQLNDDLLQKANKTVSTEGQEPMKTEAPEFDIDTVKVREKFLPDVPATSGLVSKAHKHKLCESHTCGNMCEVLAKIDKVNEQNKVKKMKLSLKYRKKYSFQCISVSNFDHFVFSVSCGNKCVSEFRWVERDRQVEI